MLSFKKASNFSEPLNFFELFSVIITTKLMSNFGRLNTTN